MTESVALRLSLPDLRPCLKWVTYVQGWTKGGSYKTPRRYLCSWFIFHVGKGKIYRLSIRKEVVQFLALQFTCQSVLGQDVKPD